MSEKTQSRLMSKLLAAAVISTLAGGLTVEAAPKNKKPPPPPPPPPAPARLEPLNVGSTVHWFAAWDERTNPPTTDFIITPSNVDGFAFAQAQYNASSISDPSRPLGLIVETPLTSAVASQYFNTAYPTPNGKAISYVFADFESPSVSTRYSQTRTLVTQVRGATWSQNAYVGNFDMTPAVNDPSRRGAAPYTQSLYSTSGVNMANTALYPGAPTFRNTSTGDWENTNIRTGLFIGPIIRASEVQYQLNKSFNGTNKAIGLSYHKQVPWVARFNNWGNASLDTDGDTSNGYQFVGNGQMMGRGDFSAQVLHYRMRGAYSVNLLSVPGPNGGGAIGYSGADAKYDVRAGWYGAGAPIAPGTPDGLGLGPIAHQNAIWAAADSKPATLINNPVVDGKPWGGDNSTLNTSEKFGTMWSGVYSLTLQQMDILVSNLDTVDHLVRFNSGDTPYEIFTFKDENGYTYKDPSGGESGTSVPRNILIEAGMHRLLQFDLVTTRVYNSLDVLGQPGGNRYSTQTIWLLNQNYLVFNNNGGRNDVGIPEPTTFGMFAAAGSMALVCRRHRRHSNA